MRKCTSCSNKPRSRSASLLAFHFFICVLLFYLRFTFLFTFCFFICVCNFTFPLRFFLNLRSLFLTCVFFFYLFSFFNLCFLFFNLCFLSLICLFFFICVWPFRATVWLCLNHTVQKDSRGVLRTSIRVNIVGNVNLADNQWTCSWNIWVNEHGWPRFYFIKVLSKQMPILDGKITSVFSYSCDLLNSLHSSRKLTLCPMPGNEASAAQNDIRLQTFT